MTIPVESAVMTPKGTAPVWICRHCKSVKIIARPSEPEPERCWNYKCRRMDWHRDKILPGRPRQDAKTGKAKAKTARKKGTLKCTKLSYGRQSGR